MENREDGKRNAKFVGQLVRPKNYKLLSASLVWSPKTEGGFDLIENDSLNPYAKQTLIQRISNTNQFSVTIKGMPAGRFIRGKIFATLVDAEGKETCVYSEERRADAK